MQPTIISAPFGPDATLYTLTNANGMIVKISTLGGVITEIHTPDRNGQLADICLGFDDPAAYLGESHYFGALIGRYGNRIANGRFTLDGETHQLDVNNGINHLHGGQDGFHRRLWEAESFATPKSAGLILSYLSPDGEQGYPGNLEVTVIYELRNDNELRIAFHAISDKATPVNLTNHAYFNLAGKGDILSHELTIVADAYTPVDSGLIPTGELPTVAGTPFDFRTPHAIGARIGVDDEQLRHGAGYDHNFVLNKSQTGALELAARVRDPSSGRVLEVVTQEPGIQFYSGNFLHDGMQGKGRIYGHRSGFCLEPQHYPDSPNRAEFPSTILRPGAEYTTVMGYRFAVED
ncbi:aldose epimerase family protein [Duganella sp. HH105]|uniref:aldose epimerase family protein n=1 Tax=Duganella sp. HH105 TaxID=1781067 RepID=UPI000877C10E|nr:aldose epimerase family protein [Duganella sp. HH105]OEZ57990.1 aldose 1-epimerase precursor [Duganella sp. HH105]